MTKKEIISKYLKTTEEIKAYKLCLIWCALVDRELPNYKTTKLKKGDPRKSILFKYCYKLYNETREKLQEREYKYYILAQIQILKSIKDSKGIHALIEPWCLTGEKAWKRWQVWCNRFYKKANERKCGDNSCFEQNIFSIKIELEKTKAFLLNKFQHYPTIQELQTAAKEGFLIKWLMIQQVSPYYALLSPFIQNLQIKLPSSIEVFKPSITPEVVVFFKKLFSEEYH